MSPRKVRLVVDVIRGLDVNTALDQLKFINKQASKPIIKLILSGIASGNHNWELEQDNLWIKEIKVDEGATLKRWMPRAHGRATPIRKRTSHISIVLAEIKESAKKKAKKTKLEAPVKLGAEPKKDDIKKGELTYAKALDKKAKESKTSGFDQEKDKEIVDPRSEGRGGHTKVEGGKRKGFASRFFRRKSG